eukprot:CAMPEP_0170227596 /NCGR_PEP_ID=MMETSP0116_2-20130129/13512_1 /TAXON_ID=400756 /ORGANISM="Durinskia baltica, Strain CSIRO CS-38" /LENGTH=226 /DNA_ID=CAMNT_0010478327 /DNA_START=83 /DNA_END=763 /DNA_ORIENTATION=+
MALPAFIFGKCLMAAVFAVVAIADDSATCVASGDACRDQSSLLQTQARVIEQMSSGTGAPPPQVENLDHQRHMRRHLPRGWRDVCPGGLSHLGQRNQHSAGQEVGHGDLLFKHVPELRVRWGRELHAVRLKETLRLLPVCAGYIHLQVRRRGAGLGAALVPLSPVQAVDRDLLRRNGAGVQLQLLRRLRERRPLRKRLQGHERLHLRAEGLGHVEGQAAFEREQHQ